MNVSITLTYKSRGIKVQRRGSFQVRGRTAEKVATAWITEIKKEMEVEEILKVEADGVDITSNLYKLEWK